MSQVCQVLRGPGSGEAYTRPDKNWDAGVPGALWDGQLEQRKGLGKGGSELREGACVRCLYGHTYENP